MTAGAESDMQSQGTSNTSVAQFLFLYLCMQRDQSCLSGRSSACVQVSQLGAMAAPALMMLAQLPSAASVPFFVWGPTAIAAGLLLWLLPDTLGASIPASVQVRP